MIEKLLERGGQRSTDKLTGKVSRQMNGWTGNKGEIQREKPEPTSFRWMAPIGIFWYKNVNENNSFRLRGVSCCTFAENRASQN